MSWVHEFADLVGRMRAAQRAYFSAPAGSREKSIHLAESKALERRVDRALEDFGSQPQPSLFDAGLGTEGGEP